jgi:hypothetical protein
VVTHEPDGVAAYLAAEAVVEAVCGVYLQRGGAFVVEDAEAFESSASCAYEVDNIADYLPDVGAFADGGDVCG